MIFQQFNLVPRLDVVSNVLHGTLNRRSTLATMFNLFPARGHPPRHRHPRPARHRRTCRQARRGAVGRPAAARRHRARADAGPAIILADEPIASLDPMNAQIVMDALRRIHDEDGRMVICQPPHARHRAALLRPGDRHARGRIVFDGVPAQLTTGVARDIYGADESFSEP
jgi:phosphonate transport system ATP-binding protein